MISSSSTNYNTAGLVESTTDQFGKVSTNFYDATGNLIESQVPVHSDVIMTFEDGSTIQPGDYLMVTRSHFDDNGRAVASMSPFLMDIDATTRLTPTADLRLSHTIYDNLGRVMETRQVEGVEITTTEESLPSGDGVTLDSEFPVTYDGTEYVYPADAVVVSSSKTYYAEDGLVHATVSSVGGYDDVTTIFEYDSFRRQTHTIQFVDLNRNNVIEGLDDDGPTFTFSLNDPSPDAIISKTVYDSVGRQEQSMAPGGSSIRYFYDGLGRVTETQMIDPNEDSSIPGYFPTISTFTGYDVQGRSTTSTDAMGLTTTHVYNEETGRLDAVQLPGLSDGERYQYGYDEYGNQTSITAPDVDTADGDPSGRITFFTHDHRGRQLTRTLPLGQQEEMVYVNDGVAICGLLGTACADGPGVIDPELGSSVKFGQLEYMVAFADLDDTGGTRNVVTAYRYDNTDTGGGRLVGTYFYDSYDDYLADPSGSFVDEITYEYDAFGRSIATTFTQNDASPSTHTTTNSYDADGRLTVVDSNIGQMRYAYDDSGRMIESSTWDHVLDAARHSVFYSYDSIGRIATVTNQSESPTTYNYLVSGNMSSVSHPNGVTTTYGYDSLDRLTSVSHAKANQTPISTFVYTLRADGKRVQEIRSDAQRGDTQFDWVYDDLGRLVGEAYQDSGVGDGNYLHYYNYDAAGNRTALNSTDVDVAGQLASFLETPESVSYDHAVTYSYDINDRLLREHDSEAGQTTFYEYGNEVDYSAEIGGNSTKQTSRRVYTDASNELDEPPTGAPESETQYRYNLQGRQAGGTIEEDSGTTSTSISYRYNANGIRISQTEGNSTTLYHVDENNPTGYAQVREEGIDLGPASDGELSTSEVQRSYVFGTDVLRQIEADGTDYFLLYDAHGSTRALLDLSGAVVGTGGTIQLFDYSAYGKNISVSAATPLTSSLYSGEFTDQSTGQQYLRARYYDSGNGRFNRLDPYAGNVNNPLSFHKYAYANMNPVSNIDPSGLVSFSVAGFSVNFSISSYLGATAANYAIGKGIEFGIDYGANGRLDSFQWFRMWDLMAFIPGAFWAASFRRLGGVAGAISREAAEQAFARLSSVRNYVPGVLQAPAQCAAFCLKNIADDLIPHIDTSWIASGLDEGILSLITGGGGKGIRTGDIIHVAERLGMASVPTFEIRSLQHIRSFLDDGSQHLLAILGPRAEGHAVRIVDVLDDGFLKIYAPAIGFYEQAADALFSRNVTGEFVKVFS